MPEKNFPYDTPEDMRRRLENDYVYPAFTVEQAGRCNEIRSTCKELAILLTRLCPASRELSLALTHIEEATFYANAAIARNEK